MRRINSQRKDRAIRSAVAAWNMRTGLTPRDCTVAAFENAAGARGIPDGRLAAIDSERPGRTGRQIAERGPRSAGVVGDGELRGDVAATVGNRKIVGRRSAAHDHVAGSIGLEGGDRLVATATEGFPHEQGGVRAPEGRNRE